MHGYRDVIAIREVWTTLLLSALIRIPIFSLGIVMSVHVVSSLHLDYVRAGAVTTVVTVAGCGAQCFPHSSPPRSRGDCVPG